MEQKQSFRDHVNQSITLKAIIVAFLALLLLIPGQMIQGLIRERQHRAEEAVRTIDARWSVEQTVAGPVLVVPYVQTVLVNGESRLDKHKLYITPDVLNMTVKLSPEVKHLGIYKSILYRSEISLNGFFSKVDSYTPPLAELQWNEAYLSLGLTDLKGISQDVKVNLNGKVLVAEASGNPGNQLLDGLAFDLKNFYANNTDSVWHFSSKFNLKGSESMSFLPLAHITNVDVSGAWKDPGFIGGFSPDSKIDKKGFTARWNILHFNRNIPDAWKDNGVSNLPDATFGVSLVDTVNQYQQNMRSAKYAIMFIALTFLVFFFVEILTKKRIHPLQYLLVGFALLIFYTLLLSISEQIGFGWAYLVASVATVGLITVYAGNVFKNAKHTSILGIILAMLYVFLYVVLQLEDVAFLVGSIGLFLILGIVMYVSRNIKWYQDEN